MCTYKLQQSARQEESSTCIDDVTYKAKWNERPFQVEKANKFNKNTITYEQIGNYASQTDKG